MVFVFRFVAEENFEIATFAKTVAGPSAFFRSHICCGAQLLFAGFEFEQKGNCTAEQDERKGEFFSSLEFYE